MDAPSLCWLACDPAPRPISLLSSDISSSSPSFPSWTVSGCLNHPCQTGGPGAGLKLVLLWVVNPGGEVGGLVEWTTGKSIQFNYDGNKFLSVCYGLEDIKCRVPGLGSP